jgi:hypothetical protein
VYRGETLDLRRNLDERRNAFNAEHAEDTLRLGSGQAGNAEEEGEEEKAER